MFGRAMKRDSQKVNGEEGAPKEALPRPPSVQEALTTFRTRTDELRKSVIQARDASAFTPVGLPTPIFIETIHRMMVRHGCSECADCLYIKRLLEGTGD